MRIQEWKAHPEFPVERECPFRGCWEFELSSGETTIPHRHDDGHEIDIVLAGSGKITVGDVTRDVTAGDVIFVPASVPHLIRNDGEELLRGLTIESVVPEFTSSGVIDDLSIHDLDELIESIPENLDVSGSLQMIIRLFDLAGYISEQIDESVGLDNEQGFEALKQIEVKVMDAVVAISQQYQLNAYVGSPDHPRF